MSSNIPIGNSFIHAVFFHPSFWPKKLQHYYFLVEKKIAMLGKKNPILDSFRLMRAHQQSFVYSTDNNLMDWATNLRMIQRETPLGSFDWDKHVKFCLVRIIIIHLALNYLVSFFFLVIVVLSFLSIWYSHHNMPAAAYYRNKVKSIRSMRLKVEANHRNRTLGIGKSSYTGVHVIIF